jgi:hypothetical protein
MDHQEIISTRRSRSKGKAQGSVRLWASWRSKTEINTGRMPKARKAEELETARVRIIETQIPTFMGVDRKIYKLTRGDVVQLPKVNADLLVTHGVAVHTKARVTAKPCDIPLPPSPRNPHPVNVAELSAHDKALLSGNYLIERAGRRIPAGLELQQSVTGKGGQTHLKTVGVNVPTVRTKKSKRKRTKTTDLAPFGIPKAGQRVL